MSTAQRGHLSDALDEKLECPLAVRSGGQSSSQKSRYITEQGVPLPATPEDVLTKARRAESIPPPSNNGATGCRAHAQTPTYPYNRAFGFRPTPHDSQTSAYDQREQRSGRRGVCFDNLATASKFVASCPFVVPVPNDLSLVIQVRTAHQQIGLPSVISHTAIGRSDHLWSRISYTAIGRRVYVQRSTVVVDLSSRGYPPTPSEESGEVRPRAKARASGRSRNLFSVEEANRY